MNVLYFGIFERPFDTEVFIANSLEDLGCKVDRVNMRVATGELIEQMVAEKKYDFILLSKGRFPQNELDINVVFKRIKILKVGWFFDLAWGTMRENHVYVQPVFKCTDIVFTTDGGHPKNFRKAGINHSVLRQGIYDKEAYFGKEKKEYKHDVIFVGTNVHAQYFRWPYRGELLRWLQKTYGERFKWYGGSGKEIRNDELNNLYASAKVVVGDSVYSPHYWSNRLYETIGRGGFLIFPNIPGLEDEFEYYKHFIPYNIGDWDGLKKKIDYYISHDEERNAIRKAGLEYCKKNHTYKIRCEKLLKIVKDILNKKAEFKEYYKEK